VTRWEIDSLQAAVNASNVTLPMTEESTEHKTTWLQWFSKFSGSISTSLISEGNQPVRPLKETLRGTETQKPESGSSVPSPLPWLRRKYDLRPHGIDLIVDFGWNRSD
jgi:hypothetical protein